MHDTVVEDIANNTNSFSPQAVKSTMDVKPDISSLYVDPTTHYTHPGVPSTSNTFGSPSSTAIFTQLPLPQLRREDTPNVHHWFEQSYSVTRKRGKNGEANPEETKFAGSILSCYLEDENGDEIPKAKRNEARSVAKGFFNYLLREGKAPPAWGKAGIDIQNEYLHLMEGRFPFLRLCDNHWKAMRIATNSYSQWYGKTTIGRPVAWVNKAATGEIIDVDADDGMDKPSKRPRAKDDDVRRSKRPCAEATESTPPPRPTKITRQRQRVCDLPYLNSTPH